MLLFCLECVFVVFFGVLLIECLLWLGFFVSVLGSVVVGE